MKTPQKQAASKQKFPVWILGIITVAVIALVIWLGTQAAQPASTTLPAEISVSQAVQKRDAGAFVLDVREPGEWVQFHIPGATLIPLGELPNRLKEVPKDREVVV